MGVCLREGVSRATGGDLFRYVAPTGLPPGSATGGDQEGCTLGSLGSRDRVTAPVTSFHDHGTGASRCAGCGKDTRPTSCTSEGRRRCGPMVLCPWCLSGR